ncbi:MAG: hypothetical protein WCB96_07585 [Candidatus Aminicenantales bacterium]
MKHSNRASRFLRAAVVCLVLAAACGRPGLAWNPGDATVPDNKWVTVDGVKSYQTDSYNSELDFSGGIYHRRAHIYILQHAIDILNRDGYDNWAALLQNNLLHLASGSKHADTYKGRVEIHISLEILWGLIDVKTWVIDLTCAGGCDHYHDVNTDDGLDLTTFSILGDAADFLIKLITMLGPSQYTYGLVDLDVDVVPDLRAQYPSGLKLCQKHYLDAQKAWDGKILYPDRSALDSAFYELGWACHLMADLAVAQHLHGEFIGGHAGYEDAADGLGEDSDYPNHHATTAKGIYAFSSASGSQAVSQLATKLVNILYPDSDHHNKAENGDTAERLVALKKALPLAEKYTAALMAQFLNEAGIPSTTPPLEGYIRVMGGEKVPYAYIFFAPAGYTIQIEQNLTAAQLDPKKDWKGWSYIRADSNGFYKLPVKKFRKYWLRPAMPGYNFTGQTSYNLEFGVKKVPALFAPPNISYSKETLDLYMEPQPLKVVLAFKPGQEDKTKMKMVKFAGGTQLMTGLRPQLVAADQKLALSKTKLTATLAEVIYKGVVKAECSASALQTKGGAGVLSTEANVILQVSDLVSIFDGQTVQSAAEITATVDKARVKLQQARAAAKSGAPQQQVAVGHDIDKATFVALQAKLPATTVSAGGSKTMRVLTPSSAFHGSEGADLLIENGLLLVPSKAGVELEVSADSGTGLLTPAQASLTLTTDDSGAASFKVQSGSHAGKLVLRFKVTKNPAALDIRPEGVVEILIQPGLDKADPNVETPVSLTRAVKLKMIPLVMATGAGRRSFRERVRVEQGRLVLSGRPSRQENLERLRREEEARRPPEPEPEVRPREGDKRVETPQPPTSFDISGEWHSNVRCAFLVKQNGDEFTWEGIDRRQAGRGRINGRQLEASWEGEPEAGQAKGEVVEATPEGWAFRIQWTNGMVFFRPPKGEERGPEPPEQPRREEPPPPPVKEPEPPPREEPQPPRQEPQPAPQSQQYDISGRWTSSTRLVYQVRQEGNTFSWQVEGQDKVLKGTINGRTLQTSWTGRPSTEKVTGDVVEATEQGRALVIRWSNGVEFRR